MKILFVSASPLEYSASANMRNLALLSGFIKNGHDVFTLTPKPQEDSKLYDKSLCNINIKKKYYIEMGTLRSKITMKRGKKNNIKKLIYKLVSKFKLYDFRSSLAKKDIKIDDKFDIIISSSDPKSSHLIAESLIINNPNITKKWLQYWGDPFANDINKKNILPKFLVKREEARLISMSDKVIYVSPLTLKQQIKIYPQYKEKMLFYPIPYLNEIIYSNTMNEKPVIGYYGDYNKNDRNIMPLYDTVLEESQEFCLKICGASDLNLKDTENIFIKPRQNLNVIRDMEKDTDILVCICNRHGTQIPGKIYHYSATNKPILIILDGDNKKELKQYFDSMNRFIMCENNKNDIKKAIKRIIDENLKFQPSELLKAENIANNLIKSI